MKIITIGSIWTIPALDSTCTIVIETANIAFQVFEINENFISVIIVKDRFGEYGINNKLMIEIENFHFLLQIKHLKNV